MTLHRTFPVEGLLLIVVLLLTASSYAIYEVHQARLAEKEARAAVFSMLDKDQSRLGPPVAPPVRWVIQVYRLPAEME